MTKVFEGVAGDTRGLEVIYFSTEGYNRTPCAADADFASNFHWPLKLNIEVLFFLGNHCLKSLVVLKVTSQMLLDSCHLSNVISASFG